MSRAITTITLNAKKIAFVACAMPSKGNARITLEGICVESTQEGVILTATDGNIMLAARSAAQETHVSDVLHVTSDFLSSCRLSRAELVSVNDKTWHISDKDGNFIASGVCSANGVHWRYSLTTPSNFPYPDWRRGFQDTTYNKPVRNITSETASRVAKAAKIERLGFSLYGSSEGKKSLRSNVILVAFSVDDYSGLIMPFDQNGPEKITPPSWCIHA